LSTWTAFATSYAKLFGFSLTLGSLARQAKSVNNFVVNIYLFFLHVT
jgi:hypothetical protein